MTFLSRIVRTCLAMAGMLLELQLFLLLISWPILLWWGISFPLLSIISNGIFSPLLTIILALTTILCLFTSLALPVRWLASALDALVYWWNKILSYAPPLPVLAYATPPLALLLTMPFIAVSIIFYITKRHERIALLCSTLLIMSFMCSLLQPKNVVAHIVFRHYSFLLIKRNNYVLLIDKGRARKNRFTYSFINYQLKPLLLKKWGITHIDRVILLKKTKSVHEFYTLMHADIPIGKIL